MLVSRSVSCLSWLACVSSMGGTGARVAGLVSAFLMSLRLARMSSFVDGVGILICFGNHDTVSQIRSLRVSHIQMI